MNLAECRGGEGRGNNSGPSSFPTDTHHVAMKAIAEGYEGQLMYYQHRPAQGG